MRNASKVNYDENFDPYAHLKQSLKEDGLPAYTPYIKDGSVVIGNDAKIVMVPEVHLDANAYRDWFHKAYPNGYTEIIRHTEAPFMTSDQKIIYPQEVFEVKFYISSDARTPKTSGWGRAAYAEGNEFDEIGTAISKAFKNGMRNMGFGVDLEENEILKNLPKYVETTVPGRLSEFIPAGSIERSAPPSIDTKNTAEQGKMNTDAITETSMQGQSPQAEMPGQSSMDVFDFLEQKRGEDDKEEAKKVTPDAQDHEAGDPHLTAPIQEQNPPLAKPSASVPPTKVIFNVINPNDPLSQFAGKTLGEILDINKSVITTIARETFQWESRIPEEVYLAAKELL